MSDKSLYEIISTLNDETLLDQNFVIKDYVSECMHDATHIIDKSMNIEQRRSMFMIIISGVIGCRAISATTPQEVQQLFMITQSDLLMEIIDYAFLAGIGVAAREELR